MGALFQWVISLAIALVGWLAFARMFPGAADLLRFGNARLQQTSHMQALRRLLRRIELVLFLFVMTTVIRALIQVLFGWHL